MFKRTLVFLLLLVAVSFAGERSQRVVRDAVPVFIDVIPEGLIGDEVQEIFEFHIAWKSNDSLSVYAGEKDYIWIKIKYAHINGLLRYKIV